MARKYKEEKSSGRVILLVDDNVEYLEATQMVLEHEGHRVLCAGNGHDALKLLEENTVDLILLDYFMPEMTGEQVVTEIRKSNSTIQIILQTGYASENPPRDLLQRLNIQGYYDKSEGTDKLLLWVDVGLKAAYTVNLLNKSRQGLNYILDITPEMHKIQPLDDLLQGILWQFSGLLGFSNSFLAVVPHRDIKDTSEQKSSTVRDNFTDHSDGIDVLQTTCQSFLAIVKDDSALRIHAGIGKFAGKIVLEDVLDSNEVDTINRSLAGGTICYHNASTYIPLRVGETILGIIYLDKNIIHKSDLEMLNIFANQAAVAIQNAQLYDMATRDQLTDVNIRRYTIQLLIKELRSSFHLKTSVSLLSFDLDNLKSINDTSSHAAGDRALSILGKVFKKATRTNDFIGRFGGDEFLIALPDTEHDGAVQVADRINKMLSVEKIYGPGIVHTLSGSIGIVTLRPITLNATQFPHPLPHRYFQAMAHILLEKSDETMYLAKKSGKSTYAVAAPVNWLNFSDAIAIYDRINKETTADSRF